jgi:hypothetical protein
MQLLLYPSKRWAHTNAKRQELETREQIWNARQITNGVRVRHGEHF